MNNKENRRGITPVQNGGEHIQCAGCFKLIPPNGSMWTTFALSLDNKFFHSETCIKKYVTTPFAGSR